MKLRIQDNRIRIRVTLEELSYLVSGNSIVMKTPIGNNPLLTKVIPIDQKATVTLSDNTLSININQEKIYELSSSDHEGFEDVIKINDEIQLVVLFQKDYVCIGRSDTSNKGLFPNPKIKNGTC